MRFAQKEEALTFDDVLLVPAESKVSPKSVSLKTQLTREIGLCMPILSSAMDTVTESKMAIAMAKEGGMGVIHKNMTIEQQAAEVRKVKKFESGVVRNPVTVPPTMLVGDVIALTQKNNFSALPIVDGTELVGLVTSRDLRFERNLSQQVGQMMTPKSKLITVKEGVTRDEVIDLLHRHRIEKLLIVNDDFELQGMITEKDIMRETENPNATKDGHGCLRVAAAVSTGAGSQERTEALIEAGVDVIVVDTAHGHSQGVLDKVKWVRQQSKDIAIIGGNIATASAAEALVAAGADAVKVGIGPGSICTTRIVTGVGVPQLTAIYNVSEALKKKAIPVIADGGIRYSGDLCKAIAAGASVVMMGSLLAGTDEAPGEIELYQGRSYKSYRGMGSLGAMAQSHGSSDRYFQDISAGAHKLVPEGIEGRVPYKGPVSAIIYQMIGGLSSAMGYTGCADMLAMRTQAQFMKISSAGINESHVHDVKITKEAPNYGRD